jgi:hypothetical protein
MRPCIASRFGLGFPPGVIATDVHQELGIRNANSSMSPPGVLATDVDATLALDRIINHRLYGFQLNMMMFCGLQVNSKILYLSCSNQLITIAQDISQPIDQVLWLKTQTE